MPPDVEWLMKANTSCTLFLMNSDWPAYFGIV
jgi:hypothetical protein